jgi:hypothetical protein
MRGTGRSRAWGPVISGDVFGVENGVSSCTDFIDQF